MEVLDLPRRLHNLDVEVAASGFTTDMDESFEEVQGIVCVSSERKDATCMSKMPNMNEVHASM